MATEKIEPLPRVKSPVKKPAAEKPVKPKAKGGRAKGRISTPERKPVRKEPLPLQKDEMKKKKGFCCWSDIKCFFLCLSLFLFSSGDIYVKVWMDVLFFIFIQIIIFRDNRSDYLKCMRF